MVCVDKVDEVDLLCYVSTGLRLVRLTSSEKLNKLVSFFKTKNFIFSASGLGLH